MPKLFTVVGTSTSFRFLFNWSILWQLFQEDGSPTGRPQNLLRKKIFTGQMPFLSPNQQCQVS